jgi:predicted RNase H-like nuclease (RuvC/YqgF family)
VRLSIEEVQKQHENTKKLYEQGLTVAPVDVKRVLDLYNTIEALQQENERLKGAIQEWVDGVCISQKHLSQIGELQQENEQLISENASLRNWNACEEKLHNELLESDKRRIELESELEAEKDYRAGLEAIIKKLQAQAARMREALNEAICCIESGRLCSIGSFHNIYSSQISVSSVERWKEALAEIEAIGGKNIDKD